MCGGMALANRSLRYGWTGAGTMRRDRCERYCSGGAGNLPALSKDAAGTAPWPLVRSINQPGLERVVLDVRDRRQEVTIIADVAIEAFRLPYSAASPMEAVDPLRRI